MKVFLDTEFIEDGETIKLLSLGAVREDGRELYLEAGWTDHNEANDWVKANVIPHMRGPKVETKREMGDRLLTFVGPNPEFWAYYADYDWVAVCQLFGRMIDLPPGWPMYCRDLKQEIDRIPHPFDIKKAVPPNGTEHHALADARWVRNAHGYLNELGAFL